MEQIKICPHCGQKMMVYRRNIRKNMLYCLRRLYFNHRFAFKKVTELDKRTVIESDFPKLRYWGLIEKGSHNTYRITNRGIKFIFGEVAVPKYRWVYNQQVQPDPPNESNPNIWAWDIAPQEISKETVLQDAKRYPYEQRQTDLFA